MRYKTREFKQFQSDIIDSLLERRNEIEKFVASFDKEKHILDVKYCLLVPKSKLYTKKGYISSKSYDIDNYIKYFQDTIFDAIGINDSNICHLISQKLPSHCGEYELYASIQIKQIEELNQRLKAYKDENCKQEVTRSISTKKLSSLWTTGLRVNHRTPYKE